MSVNRLPDAVKVKGIGVHPQEVSIQWTIKGSDVWQELRMPTAEAIYLLNALATAQDDGKLR